MSENLGLGVMLNMLSGNSETVEAVKGAIGRKVKRASFDGETVEIVLDGDPYREGPSVLRLRDDGQSCCERRYATTDDDIPSMAGERLVSIEERQMDEASVGDEEPHEQMALVITTDRAAYTIVNHNEHNGYYGGFSLVATLT